MSNYKFIIPLEVRAETTGFKKPEYIVKGYGALPNNPEIYKHYKDRNGKIIKSFKSLFTDNAIQSMNRQAKSKKIFVDAEHKTGVSLNVKAYLDKLGIAGGDKKTILEQIEITDLPMAKCREVTLDDTGLIFDLRMNPSYKEINPRYFDAVWQSLEEKFIDGLSTTFNVTKVIQEDGMEKIDDVDLYGISFTGGASSPDTQIFEVAMRAAQGFTKTQEEIKMGEDMEKVKADLDSREQALREREEASRKADEGKKQEEINRELAEAKKLKEDLQKEIEESRKAREPKGTKATVPQERTEIISEDFEYQDKIHEMMKKRVKTRKNPDGDISLGHLIALDHEGFGDARNVANNQGLDPRARGAVGKSANDIFVGMFTNRNNKI